MAIKRVKVRAKVILGSTAVETPFVLSFNVRKSRSQISTFDASLKVKSDDTFGNITGENIIISAGEGYPSNKIFTGIIKKATITPCFDDPSYVILNISGSDALSLLEGKKYTRRCKGTKTAWVTIDSAIRPGLKSGKFAYVTEPIIETEPGELTKESPAIETRDLAPSVNPDTSIKEALLEIDYIIKKS